MNKVQDRKAEQSCYQLWKDCFGDSKQYMDYYFAEKTKDNEIYTIERGEEVISMLHLNPFSFLVNGSKQRLHYIVGVATKEEERGQGLMRKVLTDTLIKQEKRGELFTYLMPAAKEIYLPYDFRYMYTQERVAGTFAAVRQDMHGVKEYESLSADQRQELVTYVNEKLQDEFDCYVLRDMAYYDRLHLEMQAAGGQVVAFYEEDTLLGVCAFMLENGHMEVVETVTEKDNTAGILRNLQGYLYESYKVETVKAVWLETHFLENEVVRKQLTDASEMDQPIIMARLLCVQKAFEQLSLKQGVREVNVAIRVEDPILPENNRTFVIYGDEAGIRVEQQEAVLQAANVTGDGSTPTIPIADLTEWYFGVRKIAALEGIQNLMKPYINDIV